MMFSTIFKQLSKMAVLAVCTIFSSGQICLGQIEEGGKKNYVKLGFGLHRAVGSVKIRDNNQNFYGNVFLDNTQQVQSNHEDNYWRPIHFGIGRHVNDMYSLGTGFDLEIFQVGDRSRTSLPLYIEAVRYFRLSSKGSLVLNIKPGYAARMGSSVHSGLKFESGLGYELRPSRSRARYGVSVSYNYQQLNSVEQREMKPVGDRSSYEQSGVRFVDVAVNSIPILFYIRF